MKEDTRIDGPWEFGIKPIVKQCKGSVEEAKQVRAQSNQRVMEVGIVESVQSGEINLKDVFFYNRSIQMLKLLKEKPKDYDACRGIWIWGCSGAGKSWAARNEFGQFFLKSQSKWWDGYQGEPTVIIDDLDFDGGDKLGHYLKIWADKYACTGETKGGTIPLNHERLIVTNNYSIEDIFGADRDSTGKVGLAKAELVKALKRRFIVRYLDKPYVPEMKPQIAATQEAEPESQAVMEPPMSRVINFGMLNPVHYMAQNNKRVAKQTDKIVAKERKRNEELYVTVKEVDLAEQCIEIEDIEDCLSDDKLDQSAEL